MAMKYNRLGDMLVESGAITEAQLKQALELQAWSTVPSRSPLPA